MRDPLESIKWGSGSRHEGRHLFGLMVPVLMFRGCSSNSSAYGLPISGYIAFADCPEVETTPGHERLWKWPLNIKAALSAGEVDTNAVTSLSQCGAD